MISVRLVVLLFNLTCDPLETTTSDHAIYLSSTEFDVSEDKILITAKIFSDDLRDAIKNHEPSRYQSGELSDFAGKNSTLIEDYFRQYLTVKTEGSVLTIHYVESTVEGDAHFIKMQITEMQKSESIAISASFLMELFPTQMNVVIVHYREQKTYLKFTQQNSSQQINLPN